jgi:hypothetical protein
MAWSRLALRDWQRFRRLSGPERWLLIQALLLLSVTAQVLRWVGVRRWQSVLARLARGECVAGGDGNAAMVQQAGRTARMVRVAAGHVPGGATCLYRSLTLWWLLRRQGLDCDLRIGVARGRGPFTAHAWVEYQGRVLGDSEDVHHRYAAFDRAIGPGRPGRK